MSGVDQPIVIAQSGYHVGHERSWRAAEEQGFVKEEGLERYVYWKSGLIPERWEPEALGEVMWERGVDIATAVDVRAAVIQRSRGEDVYIVGGWRTQHAPKLIGAKGMTEPDQIRGGKILVRSKNGLRYHAMATSLRHLGLDPEVDVEWLESSAGAYGGAPDEENPLDLLRSGQIALLPASGREADLLVDEGFTLLFDLEAYYATLKAWPPGKVIVATERTVEQRGEDLQAFLRASLRGFWFVQDPQNHHYMYDLETRLRQATFNDDERKLRMLRSEAPPPGEGPSDMGSMTMDGLVKRPALAHVIEELVQSGALEAPVDVDDVLKDAASVDAFDQLMSRGLIDRELLDQWRSIRG